MADLSIQDIVRMRGAGDPLPGSAFGTEAMPGYSVDDVYRGIIASGGSDVDPMWAAQGKTGAGVTPGNPFVPAETAIAARGDASGGAGTQARLAAALGFVPHANGTIVADKDQTRMTPNQFGYGENGVTGNEAVRVAEALAANSQLVAPSKFRPAAYRAPANPGDGGLFGIPMSSGMERILVGGQNRQAGAWGNGSAPPPNKTAAALAQVKAAAAPVPAPAPVAQSYTTTPFQESRFQTTTGAQMPGSMNNSRWTTGY